MPIVNIGTAPNLYKALKTSLNKNGFDFSKCLAFMSDTTNVMKGARSGVQKLIKNECPEVVDIGCICHIADLVVKSGMKSLRVDIDQLFIDVFYYFYHSSKRKQEFCDDWCSLITSDPQTILKHCPTRWLSLIRCVSRYIAQYDGLK
jgi:predicted HAD superfamily hydrolase